MKITPREKRRHVSPFLAWGDFHARSSFARFTIPEEKWGTTRSLAVIGLRYFPLKSADVRGAGTCDEPLRMSAWEAAVEQAISYFTVIGVSKQLLLFASIYGRLNAFFTAYAIPFFNTIVIGS